MKLKKLAALAMVGTMVLGMAGCGGSEEKAKDVSVDTVVEAFDTFMKEQNESYYYETSFVTKIMSGDNEVYMDLQGTSNAYDGVWHQTSIGKTNMFGEDVESSEEIYVIKKKDGSVVTASKEAEDDEWYVDTDDAEDVEEETKLQLNVEDIKKTAKMETKGDNCYVTMQVDPEAVDVDFTTMGNSDMADVKLQVKVTYNMKEEAIKNIEMGFDMDTLNNSSDSGNSAKVTEFSVKVENIKKNTKAIEIPSEIELD